MAAGADPTYPLLPIAFILSATMLFLVLLTSFIRQNWNFGVTLLCVCLLIEDATAAFDTIVWSDNADIKYYVYCDIGQFFAINHELEVDMGHDSISYTSRRLRCKAYGYLDHHTTTLHDR